MTESNVAGAAGVAEGRRRVWIDIAIAAILLIAAAPWGLSYWKRATVNGQPFYYQTYFEPAVMIACGKGFVVARPQVPEMVPFLWRQVDRFSCDAIGPDAPLGTKDIFQQGSWRYLMLAVGYTWRVFGVSWSALGPLFAVLYGATIVSLYGIFRLGAGRVLALACTVILGRSPFHLKYFLILRDYAKAPFTLGLLFLIGLLVIWRPTWKSTLAIAAAYGALLGIGYGFRTDFVADVPPFFVALALFLPGGVLRNIPLKAAASAICLTVYFVTAWPVLSTLDASRPGCQWHVVLLGFARSYAEPLGIQPGPYDINREYLDEYAHTNVTAYAGRLHPGIGHIEYCEALHGTVTREYIVEAVRRFPADIVVRAYASVLRIVELPFSSHSEDEDAQRLPPERYRYGLAIVLAAIGVVTASSVRLGLFLVAFLLYFCGLPGVQFDPRHFFYLEFVTWWAGAFLIGAAVRAAAGRRAHPEAIGERVRPSQAAIVLVGAFAALALLLWAARLYQQPEVRALIASYVAAPREPLQLSQAATTIVDVRRAPHTDPETADLIVVDLDRSHCGSRSAVTFRYDQSTRRPYSRAFDVHRDESSHGLTQIFMPIYDRFEAIDVFDAPAGCVDSVARVRDPGQFGMMLEAMLPPDWRRMPLYQRLDSGVISSRQFQW